MLAIFHFLCAPLLSKLFLCSFIIILLFFLSLLLLLLIIHTRYTYASEAALHFWALLSLFLSTSLPTALRSFPTVSIVFSCYSWLSFGCVYLCVYVRVWVSALFSTQLNNFLLMRLRGARCAKVFMINFTHTHARTHRYSTGIATKLASKTHTHKHKLEHTHTHTQFSEHTQKFERNFDFMKFLAFLSYFLYKFLFESVYVWLGGDTPTRSEL